MSRCTVVWKGQQVIEEVREIMMEALLITAGNILYDAKQNAPLENGILRASGRVTIGSPPDPDEVYGQVKDKGSAGLNQNAPSIAISSLSLNDDLVVYVTFSTPYARRWHEDTKWKPRAFKLLYRENPQAGEGYYKEVPKPAVGGPKYLEKAVPENWKKFKQIVKQISRMRNKR